MSNNKSYCGSLSNGVINGKGKFLYQDGSYYEGEFVKGKNVDMGYINGIVINIMKVSGKMINKMDMEFIMIKIKL